MVHVNQILLNGSAAAFRGYTKATQGGGASASTTGSGGGSYTSTASGGGSNTTSSSGGGSNTTSSSGGGSSVTSSAGGGSTSTSDGAVLVSSNTVHDPTDDGGAGGANHNHGLYRGAKLALTNDGKNVSGYVSFVPSGKHVHPAHSHRVSISEHTHKVTISNHSHTVSIPAHTHSVQVPSHSHSGGATFTCTDTVTAKAVAKRTCQTAVELFAMLCRKFSLDPLGDGVIVSHKEGCKRGIASNHGDPEHLWSQLGLPYTMDTFRKAVKTAMGSETAAPSSVSGMKIMGAAVATADQMKAYLKVRNPAVPQSVLDMVPLYLSEGAAEGLRGDITFAQSCLETGNFAFAGFDDLREVHLPQQGHTPLWRDLWQVVASKIGYFEKRSL